MGDLDNCRFLWKNPGYLCINVRNKQNERTTVIGLGDDRETVAD